MTKDLKTIDLNLLPIETLKEMANESGEQVENSARLTVQKAADCGRYLTAIKEQLEHGEWSAWLAANWDYSQKKACQYMLIAANFTLGLNLKEAASVYGALQMIADSKPEKTAPRSARKPADVKVSIPADHIADDSKKVDTGTDNKMWLVTNAELQALDDDPAPDPPTQRKTAKGSEKVPEADKPRTQQVPVEILPDEPRDDAEIITEWLTERGFTDIISDALAAKPNLEPKTAAKVLRKHADKLDPPKQVIPTVEEVAEYAASRGWKTFDAAKFWNHYELAGWKYGKAKTPLTKWHTAASQAWDDGHGWASTTSKENGNGHRTSETANNGSCLGPNGRPRVERAKITYK